MYWLSEPFNFTASEKTPQMASSDSKQNLKDTSAATGVAATAAATVGGGNVSTTAAASAGGSSSAAPQLLSAANHLEIPTNNPNLLSPDILNQRRGT